MRSGPGAGFLGVILVVAALGSIPAVQAADEETPKEVIAAQLKRQGYACDRPESATRDKERSKPDSAVWVLKCESATYRVRLVPDMKANVEKID